LSSSFNFIRCKTSCEIRLKPGIRSTLFSRRLLLGIDTAAELPPMLLLDLLITIIGCATTIFAIVADVVIKGRILAETVVYNAGGSPAPRSAGGSPASIGFQVIVVILATTE
jgi:hypothetical protein